MDKPARDKPRVVIVDAQPLFRIGVAHVLNASRDFAVVAQGATAADAQRLAEKFSPDLLFIDSQICGGGLEAAATITESSPATKMVVLTELGTSEFVEQAFRAGIRGYLVKSIDADELTRSAEIVARGELYLCQQLVTKVFTNKGAATGQPAADKAGLRFGKREEEVLDSLAKGLSNKEIAIQIGVGEKTVKYYLTHIMKKLNLRNRVEVALFASRRKNK